MFIIILLLSFVLFFGLLPYFGLLPHNASYNLFFQLMLVLWCGFLGYICSKVEQKFKY